MILTKEDWLKIGREYGVKKGATELSQELGVTRQRIQQIAFDLRKRGAPIPFIRNSKGFADEVTKILIKEKND